MRKIIPIKKTKKSIFIDKRIVPFPKSFFPFLCHYFIGDIMVSWKVKEGHFQVTYYMINLIPFMSYLYSIPGFATNYIANA